VVNRTSSETTANRSGLPDTAMSSNNAMLNPRPLLRKALQ
jgi:hypothetical protein